MAMEPFVFTFPSLLWMAMSWFSTFLIYITLNSTLWIIGKEPYVTHLPDVNVTHYPSIGLDKLCTIEPHKGEERCTTLAVDGLGTDPMIFPTLWKIAFIFYTVAFYVLIVASVICLLTCYFQVIFRKNLYNMVGCVQALAGLLLLNAVIFYMSGWGNKVVKDMCGEQSAPFDVNDCKLGAAFYYAMVGVILTFVSACISSLADRSTSSYRVTKRINAGRKFICIC